MKCSSLGLITLAGALLLGAGSRVAHAATLTVTTLSDSGRGSLRAAIDSANRTPDADTIVFAARLRGTLGLKSPLPVLTGALSIVGPGRERLNVRRAGQGRYRIFAISKTGAVSLIGLTLSNGFAQGANGQPSGDGGGVYNEGALRMNDCALVGNQSTGNGGAIFNSGAQLTLTNCQVVDNNCLVIKPEHAPANGGGGLCNNRNEAQILVTNCAFSRNACRYDGDGGAIKNASRATVRIKRTNLTDNTATRDGGALDARADVEYGGSFEITESLIANNTSPSSGAIDTAEYGGQIILTNCTVSGNTATDKKDGVGGIISRWGGVELKNCTIVGNVGSKCGGIVCSDYSVISGCIIAGNLLPPRAPGTDIYFWESEPVQMGDPIPRTRSHPSKGSNLIGQSDATTLAYFDQPSDHCKVSLAALKLGPLSDNGGPTKTYALLAGSLAIGTGSPSKNNTLTDQRGVLRSQNNNGTSDIGAFQTTKASAKTKK